MVCLLQVYQFALDESKTATIIRNSLQETAKKLGVKDDIGHFYFVTDQGSNIKAALSGNYQRIACACHCLSTALKHALPEGPGDRGETEELRSLQQAIEAVKALVRYFKQSGLNASMDRTLLQDNDTRWNSLLMMLESVTSQEEQIVQLLAEKDQQHRIDNLDFGLLRKFASFLQPLKQTTKALEGDKQPTIHLVVLWYNKLLTHMASEPFDSELIAQLKTRLADALRRKFTVSTIHHLALFLHPQYKALRKLSEKERDDVYSLARHFMKKIDRFV